MAERTIERLRSKLHGLSAASLTDAVSQRYAHRAHIPDLVSPTPGRILFGRAATIRYVSFREDMANRDRPSFARCFHEAITSHHDEAVLVLNNPCRRGTSLGGGVKFSRLHNLGVAGLITDGQIRDFAELAAYQPVFYCGGEAVEAGTHALMPIAVNVPVTLRGTTVVAGDYIYADTAAAVVIPAENIESVIDMAHQIADQDEGFIRTIRSEDPRDIRAQGSEEI